ncbi:MAG: hypothetical protein V7K27_04015 [Nostoc sp.]|uniref:hypothetical protein n=1 Tax=Nostoc sp. TaxID=1180 RepID=UPI002FF4FF5A
MEPVNFSEVIAQIDVEMQRLGWTMEQRREHLKKNYGKRSHTLLVYTELLDFLQYLVSQPTPPLHEILIAKINVETERLGWTIEQRGEHLKKTYEKRSLTLLTEVELLDFFQYLVSQPLPTLDEVLIAKINVEMQRLGWTTEQRRKHLTKNYGKPSHTLLTEVEFLDFFQYLVSQSAPTLDEVLIAKINVEIGRLWWTKNEEEQYFITTYNKPDRTLLTQEELLDFLRYLESHPIPEDNSELYAEYDEFQDFSRYSEESDKIITRMSSEDLSKVLAKTDVEMQRLGLTTEQGREHLIKTYGKRSRSLLTEEELHGFLTYLQSQPNPIAGF